MSELETLKAFLKESNLKSAGTDLFVEHGGMIYQIELRMRAAPRIIRWEARRVRRMPSGMALAFAFAFG